MRSPPDTCPMVRPRSATTSAASHRLLDGMAVGRIEALKCPPVRQATERDEGLDPHRPMHVAALSEISDLPRERHASRSRPRFARA